MSPTNTIWTDRIGLAIVFATAALIVIDRFDLLAVIHPVANLLYVWMLVLAAFTLLLGIGGVVWIHLDRIRRGEAEWSHSLLLVLSLSSVLVIGLLSSGGTTSPLLEWIFDSLIAPGQASLFALTGFFILAAAYRYLRLERPDALWMLAGTLLALLVQTPLTGQVLPPFLITLADALLNWPVMAALRGALLGGALAVLLVGVRLLSGWGK